MSPFILPCLPFSLAGEWKGEKSLGRSVNELYGFYLLHHANGQTHVYLIASSVKIITKLVAVVYGFKSASMVSCWDLYACSWAVICQYNWCYQASTVFIHIKARFKYMQGSNMYCEVQQNERNKCLGPFKRRVPKLLNLINLKMVPNVKENQLILDISLDVCISLWMLLQSIVYSVFIMLVIFWHRDALTSFTTPVSEWSPYTFINVLASNHAIKLVNTGTSTCHSTLDRWTIGN